MMCVIILFVHQDSKTVTIAFCISSAGTAYHRTRCFYVPTMATVYIGNVFMKFLIRYAGCTDTQSIVIFTNTKQRRERTTPILQNIGLPYYLTEQPTPTLFVAIVVCVMSNTTKTPPHCIRCVEYHVYSFIAKPIYMTAVHNKHNNRVKNAILFCPLYYKYNAR